MRLLLTHKQLLKGIEEAAEAGVQRVAGDYREHDLYLFFCGLLGVMDMSDVEFRFLRSVYDYAEGRDNVDYVIEWAKQQPMYELLVN